MKEPFVVVPVTVDLTNFEDMYDLGLIAQRLGCDVRILIVDAIIAFNLIQNGEHVPAISIPQIPVCDPDTLDVRWESPGYLSLPAHYAERIARWSIKRYGLPSGLETALVREAISYFLEIVYYPENNDSPEESPSLELALNEFLLNEEAHIMLSTLAENEEALVRTLAEMIESSYSSIENPHHFVETGYDIIDSDCYLVKVSERYRLMLLAIANAAEIPEEEALNLVVQYAWDVSEIAENIIIFTPK